MNPRYAEVFAENHRNATKAINLVRADIDAFAKQTDTNNLAAVFNLAHQTERKLLSALAPIIGCEPTPTAAQFQLAAVESTTSHPDFAAQAAKYTASGLNPLDRIAKVRQEREDENPHATCTARRV